MGNDPLGKYLKDSKRSWEKPEVIFFRKREQLHRQFARRFVFGLLFVSVAIYSALTLDAEMTNNWFAMILLTTVMVIMFITWVITNATTLAEWEKTERKRISQLKKPTDH